MKKFILILFSFIFVLGIIYPRFYQLDSTPPGLHIDEVSFAADAKAIAETGRDTWNNQWPLVFKAYGEWKAPGLVYAMAFWNKMLGRMDNTITRLPSAIAGVAILLSLGATLYYLKPKISWSVILFTIFVVAYSPWHFDMSRIFYEAFSALAFISFSLWFITKATISDQKKFSLWIFAAIFAGLAGYWYASIRYVVIISLLVAVFVQDWNIRVKLKNGLVLLIILLGVGFGWVADLVSDKGLNRLYYYQAKSAEGATLTIDEKRQYCYLSHDKDSNKAKYCYLFWNKPVYKVINAAKTYYTYLGTDYLFLKATSEYGFDSEYGAYLLPLLPIYLVGLLELLRGLLTYISSLFSKSVKVQNIDRLYTIYIAFTLISLIPAAIANNVNMRMGFVSLYIVAIAIGIGCSVSYSWLRKYLKNFAYFACVGYMLFISFSITQSLLHYYLVFTHSNDLMWTSDSQEVFGYVKSVSNQYDRIIDSELHGPLAPYFYGDVTTYDVQNGSHSIPDQFGFTYLTKAGKYELRHVNIVDLACEKLGNKDKSKMLVITSPNARLSSIVKFSGKSWSDALVLREVYDVDDIIAYEVNNNSSFTSTCTAK